MGQDWSNTLNCSTYVHNRLCEAQPWPILRPRTDARKRRGLDPAWQEGFPIASCAAGLPFSSQVYPTILVLNLERKISPLQFRFLLSSLSAPFLAIGQLSFFLNEKKLFWRRAIFLTIGWRLLIVERWRYLCTIIHRGMWFWKCYVWWIFDLSKQKSHTGWPLNI